MSSAKDDRPQAALKKLRELVITIWIAKRVLGISGIMYKGKLGELAVKWVCGKPPSLFSTVAYRSWNHLYPHGSSSRGLVGSCSGAILCNCKSRWPRFPKTIFYCERHFPSPVEERGSRRELFALNFIGWVYMTFWGKLHEGDSSLLDSTSRVAPLELV